MVGSPCDDKSFRTNAAEMTSFEVKGNSLGNIRCYVFHYHDEQYL